MSHHYHPDPAVRLLLARAWADGYEAGHTDARAVQATYPDTTSNPYGESHD